MKGLTEESNFKTQREPTTKLGSNFFYGWTSEESTCIVGYLLETAGYIKCPGC